MQTEMITIPGNGKSTGAFVARPAGDGRWPGVVVIQEWWGLEDHIKDVAERFAAEGFVAIAPDLYYGKVATEPDDAGKLAMELEWDVALQVIQNAIDSLLAMDVVAPKKAALTGFCMGGGLAWHGAAKLQNVAAVAPFYGGGPEMTDAEVAKIRCPVLAIYGELDSGVSTAVAKVAPRKWIKGASSMRPSCIPTPNTRFSTTPARLTIPKQRGTHGKRCSLFSDRN